MKQLPKHRYIDFKKIMKDESFHLEKQCTPELLSLTLCYLVSVVLAIAASGEMNAFKIKRNKIRRCI